MQIDRQYLRQQHGLSLPADELLDDKRRWELYSIYPRAFSEPPPTPPSRLPADMTYSDSSRATAPALRSTLGATPSALTPEAIEKIVNKRVVDKAIAEFGNEPSTHRALEAAGLEAGPPADALEREAMGFEEAGHAMQADPLGLQARELFITRAGSGQYTPTDGEALGHGDWREQMKRTLSFYLAGGIAQRIKYGKTLYPSTSDKQVIDTYLKIFPAHRDELLAEADAFTEATLKERWQEVERVAVHLQLYGKLDAERFYSLITSRVGQQTQVRRVQLPMATRSASVTSGGDTIEVCWGSGAMVKRGGYDPYYEDLPAANADLSWMNTGKCPLLDFPQ